VNITKSLKGIVALAVAGTFSASAVAAPSNAEIYDMMQEMKQELKILKAENNKLKGTVEDVAVSTDEAIKAQIKIANKSYWGGYGEIHGNWLEGDTAGTADTDKIDFHRFVLFFGHEFRDDLRFFSELEVEHSIAGEGKVGEVELEQAYIQYDYDDKTQFTGGLFLLPIGIMNETHEPATFYGTERNNVEAKIIPSTWWEGGVMVSKELKPGLNFDVALTSSLKGTDAKSYAPRDGRQKVGNAKANNLGVTARLKYTAIPGIELAATTHQVSDYCQDLVVGCGRGSLIETHGIFKKDKFQLKALYARWDIQGHAVAAKGADEQDGYYFEPSYRINDKVGIFARYSMYDNTANSGSDSEKKQYDIGLNYWIHKNVVAKIDYQDQDYVSGGGDGINIGLGYDF
jgi:hypothetical protein